jgi:hypothetical protein
MASRGLFDFVREINREDNCSLEEMVDAAAAM